MYTCSAQFLHGNFCHLPKSMKMRTKLKLVWVMCDAAEAVQTVVVPFYSNFGSVPLFVSSNNCL